MKNQPYISNYPPLADWLEKVNAICNWQLRRGVHPHSMMIENWTVNGRIVLIEVYSNGHGWNIYTPNETIDIVKTLADVEKRCGLGV